MSTRAVSRRSAPPAHLIFQYRTHPAHTAEATWDDETKLYRVRCSCGVEAEVTRADLHKMAQAHPYVRGARD